MPLTPQAKTLVDLASQGYPGLGTEVLDAAEARAVLAARPVAPVEPIPVGRVENRTAAGVPVRVYWPATPDISSTPVPGPPVVVFTHGGGFVLCSLDSHDQLCRAMTAETGAVVVSVDYRLAPEHPYPAAVDDSWAVLDWVLREGGAELGADTGRLAVAGDSAGGNLAAVLALLARERGGPEIRAQLLVYPMLDPARDSGSYRENASGYFVTAEHLRWYWEQYLGGGNADAHAAPALAEDLAGLPPAHVVTAEFDPLRDEGETYAARLREAGVEVELHRYDGVFHGFFSMAAALPEAQAAQRAAFSALRAALA
jgi:acetyl esterase